MTSLVSAPSHKLTTSLKSSPTCTTLKFAITQLTLSSLRYTDTTNPPTLRTVPARQHEISASRLKARHHHVTPSLVAWLSADRPARQPSSANIPTLGSPFCSPTFHHASAPESHGIPETNGATTPIGSLTGPPRKQALPRAGRRAQGARSIVAYRAWAAKKADENSAATR